LGEWVIRTYRVVHTRKISPLVPVLFEVSGNLNTVQIPDLLFNRPIIEECESEGWGRWGWGVEKKERNCG
jgi:hypothetical protein